MSSRNLSIFSSLFSDIASWFCGIVLVFTSCPSQTLGKEVGAFLASGSHTSQMDAHPSVLLVFLEAFAKCHPPIPISPDVLSVCIAYKKKFVL